MTIVVIVFEAVIQTLRVYTSYTGDVGFLVEGNEIFYLIEPNTGKLSQRDFKGKKLLALHIGIFCSVSLRIDFAFDMSIYVIDRKNYAKNYIRYQDMKSSFPQFPCSCFFFRLFSFIIIVNYWLKLFLLNNTS